MPKMGGIRAIVVDPQGNAIPSFSVQPQPKDSAEAPKKRLAPKTFQSTGIRQDGSFEYTGIPPGTYDIYIRAPSYAAFKFPDKVVDGDVLDLGRAVLEEGGT